MDDPLDARPAELEREEIKDYLTDQRYALNPFGNGWSITVRRLKLTPKSRVSETRGMDCSGRARHRFSGERVRDHVQWQAHRVDAGLDSSSLPGIIATRKADCAWGNQSLSVRRLHFLLASSCQKQSPASGHQLPKFDLHIEELHQSRRDCGRVRPRCTSSTCNPLS